VKNGRKMEIVRKDMIARNTTELYVKNIKIINVGMELNARIYISRNPCVRCRKTLENVMINKTVNFAILIYVSILKTKDIASMEINVYICTTKIRRKINITKLNNAAYMRGENVIKIAKNKNVSMHMVRKINTVLFSSKKEIATKNI